MVTVIEVYLCRDCEEIKPVSEYYKNHTKRGHEPSCKDCRSLRARLRYYNKVRDQIEKDHIVEKAISKINKEGITNFIATKDRELTTRQKVKAFISKRF